MTLLALPDGQFGCVLADPPWSFTNWSGKGEARNAKRHYDVLDRATLESLPVADVASKDAVLLLWATNPLLPHALALIEAWGFTFKTVGFTWAKRTPTDSGWHMGLGYWTRQNSEQCLLATRGKPKRLPTGASVRQLITSPRREHSRKPDEQYDRIEQLVAGPYLELFARTARPGWTAWGNEVGKFSETN